MGTRRGAGRKARLLVQRITHILFSWATRDAFIMLISQTAHETFHGSFQRLRRERGRADGRAAGGVITDQGPRTKGKGPLISRFVWENCGKSKPSPARAHLPARKALFPGHIPRQGTGSQNRALRGNLEAGIVSRSSIFKILFAVKPV